MYKNDNPDLQQHDITKFNKVRKLPALPKIAEEEYYLEAYFENPKHKIREGSKQSNNKHNKALKTDNSALENSNIRRGMSIRRTINY